MRSVVSNFRSAIVGVGQGIYDTYRLGGRAVLLAPAIASIAALAECAQHIAEIAMGMFDNKNAAHLVAKSAIRWDFGYIKIAAFVIAILLTARLLNKSGSFSGAINVKPNVLLKTIASIVTLMTVAFGIEWLTKGTIGPVSYTVSAISWILQAGLIVWIMSIWLEDTDQSLKRSFISLLPTAVVMMVLFLAAMLPFQALHAVDHKLAFGQPRPIIWLIMAFDAVVVGLMASVAGSALYVGFTMKATWRGWGSRRVNIVNVQS